MNYTRLYENLTTSRQQLDRKKQKDGMLESHHILPKSLGGSNIKSNLVLLTPREHFIAHWLLYKIYTGKEKAKMAYAFFRMCSNNPNQQRVTNSRLYQSRKEIMSLSCSGINHHATGVNPFTSEQLLHKSESMKGDKNPQFGKEPWNKGLTRETSAIIEQSHNKRAQTIIDNPIKGTPRTIEQKLHLSKVLTGIPKSAEHKQKLSRSQLGRKRDPISVEKSASKRRGKPCPVLVCPHCGKVGKGSAMYKWHFTNCPTLNSVQE